MRRYQACEIYADKSHGKQMNLGWFAAMETLMATAQVMDREGILVDDWEFPSPLSIDSIKEAWLELTLPGLKVRGFLVHPPTVTSQDVSNDARGLMSPSVKVLDPFS